MASGSKSKKPKYYAYVVPAVGKGRIARGVVDTWRQCEAVVSGRAGARFRSFERREDAEAWLAAGARYEAKPAGSFLPLARGIYFDAGTGRGTGVEVSVTDETGRNLLHKAVSRSELNQFGKHLVDDPAATNNYGELLALRYAMEIARKTGVKNIFGDSRLVIDYWSKWRIKRNQLPKETVTLADDVARMRETFE